MYKRIEIGGKPVELQSNAATPMVYQKVFHEDLLRSFTGIDAEGDALGALDKVKQLAFVLNVQATRPFSDYYCKVSELDYVEWLTKFEEDDFYDADMLTEVVGVWQKSARTSVAPKNRVSPQ